MSVMTRIALMVLRGELAQSISGLSSRTHKELDAEFSKLGLIEPPGDGRTKAERVTTVLAAIRDDDLERVAAELINRGTTDAAERNNIQEVLWAGNDVPQILKRMLSMLEASRASTPFWRPPPLHPPSRSTKRDHARSDTPPALVTRKARYRAIARCYSIPRSRQQCTDTITKTSW